MYIFNFILIILLIFLFIKKDIKEFLSNVFVLMIICYIFFNIGIFYSFSFKTIMCYELLQYIVFLISFILLYKNGITKKQKKIITLWYSFLVINNLLIILWPSNIGGVTFPNTWGTFLLENIKFYPSITKQVLLYDIYFSMIPIIIFALKNNYNDEELFAIGKKLFKGFCLALIISLSQYIFILLNKNDYFYLFRDFIFGNYKYAANVIVRNNIHSFYGFCSEPSAMAFALFCFQWLLLIYSNSSKIKISVLLLTILLGFMTGSLSYLVYLFILIILLILKNIRMIIQFIKIHKWLMYCITGFILIVTFSIYYNGYLTYYIDRIIKSINVVMGNKIEYSSEMERLLSIKYTFNVFLSRSIFGAGIGTVYCFSGIVSLISEIGLLGLLILGKVIKFFFNDFIDKKYLIYFLIIFLLYIVLGSISSFIYPEFYLLILVMYC